MIKEYKEMITKMQRDMITTRRSKMIGNGGNNNEINESKEFSKMSLECYFADCNAKEEDISRGH